MDNNMNEDVVFQILLWLPVVSLLRFKSVCKSWCALIESSSFVKQHLLRLNSNPSNTNLIIRDGDRFILLSGHKFESSVPMDFHQHWYPAGQVQVFNSIHGIVCLQHRFGDIDLWNPATKQLRRLPQSPIPRPTEQRATIHNRNESYPVLAFDVKTGDYKVVRIIMFTHGVDMPNCQVEVYSLSTDSWRIVHEDVILPVKAIAMFPRPICWNGICFWVGSHSFRECNDFFLSFDVSAEVFGTVPLPFVCDCDYIFGLGFLNDKIAFIRPVDADPDSYPPKHTHFEVWVWNEYGVKESWTKLYTIERFGNTTLKGFLKKGDILMETRDMHVKGQLLLYDPITQEVPRRLYVSQMSYVMQHVLYNESLVSIKGGSGAANRATCLAAMTYSAMLKLSYTTKTSCSFVA